MHICKFYMIMLYNINSVCDHTDMYICISVTYRSKLVSIADEFADDQWSLQMTISFYLLLMN